MTDLKIESRTRTQSRACGQIRRSLITFQTVSKRKEREFCGTDCIENIRNSYRILLDERV